MDLFPNCPDHSTAEMPYTKVRLEHALKVFRETASYRSQRGLPCGNLERYLRGDYAFRRASKNGSARSVIAWQDLDGDGRSDDEEYDPKAERKKLKAATTRKKKIQKRKAEEVVEERKIKKSKGEESRHDRGSAYLTLVLTTEKGRRLLRDLALVHGTSHLNQPQDQESERLPSYWKRSTDPRGLRSRRWRLHEWTDSELDVHSDENVEKLTVGLRNGKVLNKGTNVGSRKTSRDEGASGDESARERLNKEERNMENIRDHEDYHYSTVTLPPKQAVPISSAEVEVDDSHVTIAANLSLKKIGSSMLKRRAKPEATKPTISSTISTPYTSFSLERARHAQSFRSESGITTIETCYAHPINLQYIPSPGGDPCDFCSNYRMGVIGLGKRSISVFVDPDNPNQFQEDGDGWRSEGMPETKMCVSCALDRLMIMRCHAPNADNDPAPTLTTQQFARIPLLDWSENTYRAYMQDLFDLSKRPIYHKEPTSKRGGPLPSCSLCPAPAVWKCCKWQKRNKTNAPCRIPQIPALSVIRTPPSLNAPSLPPPTTQIQIKQEHTPTPTPISTAPAIPKYTNPHKTTTETINGKKRQIICLDSDTEDDIPPPFAKGHQPTIPRPSPTSSTSTQAACLKPPLRGCGLTLCRFCKDFLDTPACAGILDPKKVMGYLRRENRFGARADVRFLFGGGELERTYSCTANAKGVGGGSGNGV